MRKIIAIILALLCQISLGFGQSTQPAGSLTGRVTATGPLPEMIVYLESADPNYRFDPPAPASISQNGAQFSPSLLVVSVGQTVNFKNDETGKNIEHNVFTRSPTQPFDLGLFLPPESRAVQFSSPGVVRLYCSIHRLMDGMIYVAPSPHWAKVGPDGSYKIDSVPPGEWKVKTWQKSARYNEQIIPMKIDSVATLNIEMSRK